MNYTHTPYAREILESLNSDQPVKMVVLLKGASIGMSSGIIPNMHGYILPTEPINPFANVKKLDELLASQIPSYLNRSRKKRK